MKRPWFAAILAAVGVLAVAVGLMLVFGLLPVRSDDTGAKTLAAVLGLIGAVLSAAVTLVGTVLKYSIDDRAERRNRIDVAIRAVDLLSENCQDSTTSQIGGALLALVSLGEIDLSVALLAELWDVGKASPHVARQVLEEAFESGSEGAQITAAMIISGHVSDLTHEDTQHWPIGNLGWRKDLPGTCRLGLIDAAAKWVMCDLRRKPYLPPAMAVLYRALDDTDPVLVGVAVACLRPIVDAFPEGSVFTGRDSVTVKQVDARLNEVSGTKAVGEALNIPWVNDYTEQIRRLLEPVSGGPVAASSISEE